MSLSSNLPVPVGPAVDARRERAGAQARSRPAQVRAGPFDAHLLGQDGARRGLKGGAPVLGAARAAYLGAEYSGEADRRPVAGMLRVKAV
ncbi:MAG TPA: hypothetical protein VL460_11695 [Caulobacteraceae bacterium]|jgi:hypothetical protein|nr:hypothetical protein [Caulobacteraceae bacterium]